jgi:Type II secretion system (T2SS), protein E, N-terminal domain
MKHTLRNGGRRWSAVWQDLARKIAPSCGHDECLFRGSLWGRIGRRSQGVRLQGARYCRSECLERALAEILARARPVVRQTAVATHRIPLGLLLLSRQQLTAVQLRTALEAQRGGQSQRPRKIGAWLQELGFVSESQVTAALARQWSCPVLRAGTMTVGGGRFPAIPALLLQSFQMIPVELVEASGTLLMAFSERIDYGMLYAIEQMLGLRTEACLVCPSTMRTSLQALTQPRATSDIVFEHMEDTAECIHIIGNYSAKVEAREIRVAKCGEHLWVRMERERKESVNLVLRVPDHSSGILPSPYATAAALAI